MNSSAFRKSVSILARPLTIFAILVLFINDHFLRVYYPSWITGKIGDFAWLYFSPLALAVLLGFLFPKRFNERSQALILISAGLISGIFLLGKTSHVVNTWMNTGLDLILTRPVSLHRDPTDLIALISVVGAYFAWSVHSVPEQVNIKRGFALLAISAVLTIANAAEPDYGIACLEVEEGRLVAGNNWFRSYESWDGGLSWEEISDEEEEYHCDPIILEEVEISVPGNTQLVFRAGKGNEMEESRDGGKTWASLTGIEHLSQAEVAWLEGTRSVYYLPGPLAAVSDPDSGNLVFSMGLEGVLVRTGEGEWIPVAVGDYKLVNLTLTRIPGLLKNEIALAAVYALLLLITGAVFTGQSLFQKIWLGLAWAAWLFTLAFFQPALRTGYDLFIVNAGVIFLAISAVILVGLYLTRSWESFKSSWVIQLGMVLAGLIAVLVPYVLWALNIIPVYGWSLVLALCLGLLLMAARVHWLRKRELK